MNLFFRKSNYSINNGETTARYSSDLNSGKIVLQDKDSLISKVEPGQYLYLSGIDGLFKVLSIDVTDTLSKCVVSCQVPNVTIPDVEKLCPTASTRIYLFNSSDKGSPSLYYPQYIDDNDIPNVAQKFLSNFVDNKVSTNLDILNAISVDSNGKLKYGDNYISPDPTWDKILGKPVEPTTDIDEAARFHLTEDQHTAINNSGIGKEDTLLKYSQRYIHPTETYVPKTSEGANNQVLRIVSGEAKWSNETVELPPTANQLNKVLSVKQTGSNFEPEWKDLNYAIPTDSDKGKLLSVNATSGKAEWIAKELPEEDKTNGKVLGVVGTAAKWVDNISVPDYKSLSKESILTSDGNTLSWVEKQSGLPTATNNGDFLVADSTKPEGATWKSLEVTLDHVKAALDTANATNKKDDILTLDASKSPVWSSSVVPIFSVANTGYNILHKDASSSAVTWVSGDDKLIPDSTTEQKGHILTVGADGRPAWIDISTKLEKVEGIDDSNPTGANGKVLTIVDGKPTWTEAASGVPEPASDGSQTGWFLAVGSDNKPIWHDATQTFQEVEGYSTANPSASNGFVLTMEADGTPKWKAPADGLPSANKTSGKILAVNSSNEAVWSDPELPTTGRDNGNILKIVSGTPTWAAETVVEGVPDYSDKDHKGEILTIGESGKPEWVASFKSLQAVEGLTEADPTVDSGKVLIINTDGDPEWVMLEQLPTANKTEGKILTVNSSNEAVWSDPAPSLPTTGKTDGKVLKVVGTTPTWSDTLPMPTASDTDKVLATDASGNPFWDDKPSAMGGSGGSSSNSDIVTVSMKFTCTNGTTISNSSGIPDGWTITPQLTNGRITVRHNTGMICSSCVYIPMSSDDLAEEEQNIAAYRATSAAETDGMLNLQNLVEMDGSRIVSNSFDLTSIKNNIKSGMDIFILVVTLVPCN